MSGHSFCKFYIFYIRYKQNEKRISALATHDEEYTKYYYKPASKWEVAHYAKIMASVRLNILEITISNDSPKLFFINFNIYLPKITNCLWCES